MMLRMTSMSNTDGCDAHFNEVRCLSESQQGPQRCFERVFKDVGSYNRCMASSNGSDLAPPTTDLPDEQGSVEQCSCTCSYIQRQTPTGIIYNNTETTFIV